MEDSIEDVLRATRLRIEDLRQSAIRTAKASEHLVETAHNIAMRLSELEGRLKRGEQSK